MKQGRFKVSRSRAPQGARGLKYCLVPQRGVEGEGRAPQGARGLKFLLFVFLKFLARRAPQGARGLKSHQRQGNPIVQPVAPRKGRVG